MYRMGVKIICARVFLFSIKAGFLFVTVKQIPGCFMAPNSSDSPPSLPSVAGPALRPDGT